MRRRGGTRGETRRRVAKLECVRGHVEDCYLQPNEEPGCWYRDEWIHGYSTAVAVQLVRPISDAFDRCLCDREVNPMHVRQVLGAISADGGKAGERAFNELERIHNLDLMCLECPDIAPLLEDIRNQRTIVPRRYWTNREIVSPPFLSRLALGICYGGEEIRSLPCDDGF